MKKKETAGGSKGGEWHRDRVQGQNVGRHAEWSNEKCMSLDVECIEYTRDVRGTLRGRLDSGMSGRMWDRVAAKRGEMGGIGASVRKSE